MSMMAGMMLTLSATAFPAALADFNRLPPPGRIRDGLPVRFTEDPVRPRRSRYLLPAVGKIEPEEPARLRIRGRKVKLRVPID